MQIKRAIQNGAIIVLGLAIIAMSIGYVSFSNPSDGSISPVITNNNRWDIHFENMTKLATSNVGLNEVTGPSLSSKSTSLTFGVNLREGERFDFTVDISNAGTIPAELSTFTFAGTKGDESIISSSTGLSYTSDSLIYNVTYEDGTKLAANDIVKVGEKKKLKISVISLKTDDNLDEIGNYVFTLNLNYSQAD